MDPVDVLTIAKNAAQLIRSGPDPEGALQGAYEALGLEKPDDAEDPLVIRIVRLADAAGTDLNKVITYLSSQAGPMPWNRPDKGWGGAIEPALAAQEEADGEAIHLMEYANAEEESAREMMGDFPSFSVAEKSVSGYFGGRNIVVRDGNRLTMEQAGELRVGDSMEMEREGLPTIVHGLIDYPLDRPCLFEIKVCGEPWSVWDICCAFADQYARIYEQPEKYGIWGHDISDLWIERLLYYPEKKLIYPHVGS